MLKQSLKTFIFILLLLGVVSSTPVRGASCEDTCDGKEGDDKLQCLEDVKTACQAKLEETSVKKQTLQSALNYVNSKMSVTQSQINKTIYEIEKLEGEIKNLESNISNLDINLDQTTKLLSEKIKQSYKNSRINKAYLFVESNGLSEFLSRVKYLKIAQNHDRNSILDLERKRTAYDQQKNTKEQAQAQVLGLQDDLLKQKKSLDSQQKEKNNLLVVTKHEESRYQQLLNEAIAQQRAFSRFVTNQGGASILSNQTKCDAWGCYYNQRDGLWGTMGMGGSQYSVASYGCLISSVSMMASHQGKSIKPNDIAGNSSAFVPGQGYLYHSFSVNGINVTITNASRSMLDSELAAGRSVIAGLYSGPDHFIVIVKKEDDEYIMHDPFLENGSNRPLTDKYSVSDITSLRLVSFN